MEVKDLMATTPQLISEEIIVFSRSINQDFKPVFVDIHSHPLSVVDGCYRNVFQMVIDNGGAMEYGWSLWEGPATLEALHHAVWVEPGSGRFIDVTPQLFGQTRVLFLPDPKTEDMPDEMLGKLYFAKFPDSKVERYINLLKFQEKQFRRYRDQETGEIVMPDQVKQSLDRQFAKVGALVIKVLEAQR